MSLICLGSAHGSPGVTTTCLALAAVCPPDRRVLVVEADASGGVLAARFDLRDRPGLLSLAAATRKGWSDETVWSSTQELPGGARVLVAPPSAEHVQAALRDTSEGLATWAGAALDTEVVVDCGRLSPSPANLELLRAANVVWIVVRPTVDMLRPAEAKASALAKLGVDVGLLLVGNRPYGLKEVEAGFGVPVAGVIADDPVAAKALAGRSSGRGFRRSLLIRSAATLLEGTLTGVGVNS